MFNRFRKLIPVESENLDRANSWLGGIRTTSRFWWFSAYSLFILLTLIATIGSVISVIANLFITPLAILSLLKVVWFLVKILLMTLIFAGAAALEKLLIKPWDRLRFFHAGPIFLVLVFGVFILSNIKNQTGLGLLGAAATGEIPGGASFLNALSAAFITQSAAYILVTLLISIGIPLLFIKRWGTKTQVALLFLSTIAIGVTFIFVPL